MPCASAKDLVRVPIVFSSSALSASAVSSAIRVRCVKSAVSCDAVIVFPIASPESVA
jgi:hypothetical protein